jgi:hypothetical protein
LKKYEGDKIVIPQNVSTQEVKIIAEKAKADAGALLGGTSWLVLICIIAFIAAHAIGQGTILSLMVSFFRLSPTVYLYSLAKYFVNRNISSNKS